MDPEGKRMGESLAGLARLSPKELPPFMDVSVILVSTEAAQGAEEEALGSPPVRVYFS